MAYTDLTFVLIREPSQSVVGGESFTPGVLYANGLKFCFTCEDEDRKLEQGGVKVKTRTAIPRGRYVLTTSMSQRFGKELPEVRDVPQFSGVRCHGGNRAEDSEGCVLLGKVRTKIGIADCPDTVRRMVNMVNQTESVGAKCWLEVK